MKKYIFSIFLVLLLPGFCLAAFPLEITYPHFGPIILPTFSDPGEFLPRYIDYIYKVSGIGFSVLALFSLILGGFLYLSSLGSVSRQMEAKDRIFNAILGLLIFVSSFALLNSISHRFTSIELVSLQIPFMEIDEGVWLCNEEIRVRDPYLSEEQNRDIFLSFENYLFLKDLLKEDWLNGNLDPKIQKVVATLIQVVERNCIRFGASGEIPPNFRYPRWLYIVGNYGVILHTFPNFKGYCGPPYLIDGKFDIKNAYSSANEAYREFVLAGRLNSSDPNIEVPSSVFEISHPELPKYSLTLFVDFRLNYADHLLNFPDPGHYPDENTTSTLSFYTYRNFHEDVDTNFQTPTSTCPRLSEPFEQPCIREVQITLRNYVSATNPVNSAEYSLALPSGTKTFRMNTVVLSQRIENIDMDSCYSLKIQVPNIPETEKEWVVIMYSPEEAEPTEITEILKKPYFWCDIFNDSDRNLENNYMSYFCEDKERQKRYPCVGFAWIVPARILRIEEKF